MSIAATSLCFVEPIKEHKREDGSAYYTASFVVKIDRIDLPIETIQLIEDELASYLSNVDFDPHEMTLSFKDVDLTNFGNKVPEIKLGIKP